MDKKSKVLGSLYGACIGDALGAPTELRSTEQIIEHFGGYVKEFVKAPNDTFARGRKIGQVTDDFSMMYYILKSLIKAEGVVTEKVLEESVIAWGEDEEFFENFAGPTTRAAIENIKSGKPTDIDPYGLINFNAKATNGAAMKVAPVAMLAKGDLDKAVEYAYLVAKPTHYNSLSISGAAAVACAITKAMEQNTTLEDVIEAAIYGARKGEKLGIEHKHISAGGNVTRKIELAVELGKKAESFEQVLRDIGDYIGTNWQVVESVPAVFGILAGTNGDTMEAIYAAVNIGGDTDTIASMIGAILGALNGIESIPFKFIETVIEANDTLAVKETVERFAEIVGE